MWNESPSEFSVSKMASEQNRKRFFFGILTPPLLSVQKKTKNDEKMTKNMRPRGHRSHREERRWCESKPRRLCFVFVFFLSQKLDKIITSVRDDRHYGSSEVKIHDFIEKKTKNKKEKETMRCLLFIAQNPKEEEEDEEEKQKRSGQNQKRREGRWRRLMDRWRPNRATSSETMIGVNRYLLVFKTPSAAMTHSNSFAKSSLNLNELMQ